MKTDLVDLKRRVSNLHLSLDGVTENSTLKMSQVAMIMNCIKELRPLIYSDRFVHSDSFKKKKKSKTKLLNKFGNKLIDNIMFDIDNLGKQMTTTVKIESYTEDSKYIDVVFYDKLTELFETYKDMDLSSSINYKSKI